MARQIGEATRLDDAARAGWLYYVAGNTQDEIAQKLGVSRQSAQRLVSLAVSERLVKFRLDHPIAQCLELGARLRARFGLQHAEVVPSDPDAPDLIAGVAIEGAQEMLTHLDSDTPKIIALGTGRVLRACVEQLPRLPRPQHHLVSLVGNMMTDGSATAFNVVERMADRVGTRHNPMPLTVLVRNPEELAVLHALEPVANTLALCARADVTFVGIGHVDPRAPMAVDGFITGAEAEELTASGAVGEIVGWVYDVQGALIPHLTNDRVSSAPLKVGSDMPVIGMAVGPAKVKAILGALNGRLINGLITDEATAQAILDLAR